MATSIHNYWVLGALVIDTLTGAEWEHGTAPVDSVIVSVVMLPLVDGAPRAELAQSLHAQHAEPAQVVAGGGLVVDTRNECKWHRLLLSDSKDKEFKWHRLLSDSKANECKWHRLLSDSKDKECKWHRLLLSDSKDKECKWHRLLSDSKDKERTWHRLLSDSKDKEHTWHRLLSDSNDKEHNSIGFCLIERTRNLMGIICLCHS